MKLRSEFVGDRIHRLKVVSPSPADLDTLDMLDAEGLGEDGVHVTGNGDTDYVCGECGRVLLRNMKPGQAKGIVFACPCGALNKVV